MDLDDKTFTFAVELCELAYELECWPPFRELQHDDKNPPFAGGPWVLWDLALDMLGCPKDGDEIDDPLYEGEEFTREFYRAIWDDIVGCRGDCATFCDLLRDESQLPMCWGRGEELHRHVYGSEE
ncbi:MAG: hypothetical protein AAF555_05745 [Verrucomicrobiota bacterium]